MIDIGIIIDMVSEGMMAVGKRLKQRMPSVVTDRREPRGFCTFIWGYDPDGDARVEDEIEQLTSGELNRQGLDWIECRGGDQSIKGKLRNRDRARAINLFHIAGVGDDDGVGIVVPCRAKENPMPAKEFIESLHVWSRSEQVLGAVINACNSETGAKAAAEKWRFGVGTGGLVAPKSAIFFAKAFYEELATQEHIDVRDAFHTAVGHMEWEQDVRIKDDSKRYRIYCNEEADA